MRDLEAAKVGDDLYLCCMCGEEFKSTDFQKHHSLCNDCYNREDEEEDYDYDDGDDD